MGWIFQSKTNGGNQKYAYFSVNPYKSINLPILHQYVPFRVFGEMSKSVSFWRNEDFGYDVGKVILRTTVIFLFTKTSFHQYWWIKRLSPCSVDSYAMMQCENDLSSSSPPRRWSEGQKCEAAKVELCEIVVEAYYWNVLVWWDSDIIPLGLLWRISDVVACSVCVWHICSQLNSAEQCGCVYVTASSSTTNIDNVEKEQDSKAYLCEISGNQSAKQEKPSSSLHSSRRNRPQHHCAIHYPPRKTSLPPIPPHCPSSWSISGHSLQGRILTTKLARTSDLTR